MGGCEQSGGWVGGDLVGVGVVVEQFGVAAPVDGGVELLLGVLRAESALEQVEEESRAEVAVGAGAKAFADRAHQWRAGACSLGEDLLAGLDVGGGEFLSDLGDFDIAAADAEQVEHGGGIDERSVFSFGARIHARSPEAAED